MYSTYSYHKRRRTQGGKSGWGRDKIYRLDRLAKTDVLADGGHQVNGKGVSLATISAGVSRLLVNYAGVEPGLLDTFHAGGMKIFRGYLTSKPVATTYY